MGKLTIFIQKCRNEQQWQTTSLFRQRKTGMNPAVRVQTTSKAQNRFMHAMKEAFSATILFPTQTTKTAIEEKGTGAASFLQFRKACDITS